MGKNEKAPNPQGRLLKAPTPALGRSPSFLSALSQPANNPSQHEQCAHRTQAKKFFTPKVAKSKAGQSAIRHFLGPGGCNLLDVLQAATTKVSRLVPVARTLLSVGAAYPH